MEMHIEAAAAFKELLDHYKKDHPDYMERAAKALVRSPQTIKQYSASPTSKSFRKPPLEVIEELREQIMLEDVYSSYVTVGGPVEVSMHPGEASFTSYVVALDFADARDYEVFMTGGRDTPPLSRNERLRHQWRQIAFRAIVSKSVLAEIAGTGFYQVGWVGREHPTFGVQPTSEMVAKATAAEALTTLGRIAA